MFEFPIYLFDGKLPDATHSDPIGRASEATLRSENKNKETKVSCVNRIGVRYVCMRDVHMPDKITSR